MKIIFIISALLLITGIALIVYGSVSLLGSLINTPLSYILYITIGIILCSFGLLISFPIFIQTFRSSKRKYSEELKGMYDLKESKSSSSKKIMYSIIIIGFGMIFIIITSFVILIFYYIIQIFKDWQLF